MTDETVKVNVRFQDEYGQEWWLMIPKCTVKPPSEDGSFELVVEYVPGQGIVTTVAGTWDS